jgi:hypothetical protein
MSLAPLRKESPTSSMTMSPVIARGSRARIAVLVAGDLIAFLIFAGVGRQSHHEASGLGALGQIAQTAVPFALGWLLVAPLAGAFRRGTTATAPAMLRRTGLAWLAAWPVTLVLRWVFTGMRPALSFALVILLANAVFLGLWRAGFALVTSRLRTAPPTLAPPAE